MPEQDHSSADAGHPETVGGPVRDDHIGHHAHPETVGGPAQRDHVGHAGHPYEIWDVFTDTPLEGNPLGVFPVAEELPSRLYQRLARELNRSETVFLLPDDPAEADAQIRIFTPGSELPFAGHPTLGAAYVLSARHGYGTVRLRTAAGIIAVTMSRDEDGEITRGEMRQPIPTVAAYPESGQLLAALAAGTPGTDLEATTPVEIYTNGPSHVVVTLADRDTLSALAPDMNALAALVESGVAVIARTAETAFASRNFHPAIGVPEDPATGSAAGPVAVHLLRHGQIPSGQTITLTQGVEIARPSTLWATATGTPETIQAVTVAGQAVKVAAGHYRVG